MKDTGLNGVVLRGPVKGGVVEWRMPTGSRWYPLYEEDEDFRLWFDNLSRGSPATAVNNARILYRFLGVHGWSIDELTDRIKDTDKFEKFLISFVGQQERLGYAPGTIDNYLKAVKSWANWQNVNFVRNIKISNRSSTPTLDDEKVPTVSQVQDIRTSARTLRGKICVGGLAYGGLRPEVLGHEFLVDGLRLGDLPELDFGGLEFETFPTLVVVRPELSKAKHKYRTFFPKETCKDILAFLRKRVGHGEVLTEKSPIASVNPNLRRGQLGYGRDFENGHLRAISISRDIRNAIRPAYNFRPYVLRSFFATRLLMAVSDGLLDNNYRIYWMGQKGSMAARYSSNKAELPDDLIESMRAAYSRSRRHLLGDAMDEESIRKKQMLANAKLLGFGEEKLGTLREMLKRARNVDEALEEFQKLRERPSDVSYKVAENEAEMLERLGEGWTLERDLSGGRFLVKRN